MQYEFIVVIFLLFLSYSFLFFICSMFTPYLSIVPMYNPFPIPYLIPLFLCLSLSFPRLAGAWQLLGSCDARYLQSDGFLISGDGVLALVAGPLALYYAWATFVRHSSGHLVGVIAACILIYTQVLYYAIEFQSNFKDISTKNLPVFIPIFVVINAMRIIFPSVILWIESRIVLEKMRVADEVGKLQSQSPFDAINAKAGDEVLASLDIKLSGAEDGEGETCIDLKEEKGSEKEKRRGLSQIADNGSFENSFDKEENDKGTSLISRLKYRSIFKILLYFYRFSPNRR